MLLPHVLLDNAPGPQAPPQTQEPTQQQTNSEKPQQKQDGGPSPSATSGEDWEKRFKGQSRIVSQQAEQIKALQATLEDMQKRYEQLQRLLQQAAGVETPEETEPDPVAIAQQAVKRVEELQRELQRKELESMKLRLLPPELQEFADTLPTPDDPQELRRVVNDFKKKMEKLLTKTQEPTDPIQTTTRSAPAPQKATNKTVDAKVALEKWYDAVAKGDEEEAQRWSERYLKLTGDTSNMWSDVTVF